MCGIAGILRVYPQGATVPAVAASIPQAWLDVLDEHIKHRGPDGFGVFRDRAVRSDGATVDVALIHRRLAIIDPADGQQPMVSRDGRVAVVFNGCIYNHAQLRRELEHEGNVFVTNHCDTEVIVQGWLRAEEFVFQRLDGMYACAIWDREHADVFLARDEHGEKPLYHKEHGSMRYFASSFAACSALGARLQAERVLVIADGNRPIGSGFLRHGAARVFDSRANELGSGTHEYRPQGRTHEQAETKFASSREYLESESVERMIKWYVHARRDIYFVHGLPDDHATLGKPLDEERTEHLLRRSVIDRLTSDVPLGCFLSGGVDSSLIASFAQSHLRQSGERLKTFTMRMEGAYDESHFAAQVAKLLETEHYELTCATDVASDLVKLIEQLGLPFGDSSLLPTYWLCKATRQHVKVALAGDGGDELFAGYERHNAGRLLKKYGDILRDFPPVGFPPRHPKSVLGKLARLVNAAHGRGYDDLLAVFPSSMFNELTSHVETEAMREDARFTSSEHEPWHRDTRDYLPNDLLRKTDTASMAVALEVRCPFLSRELSAAAWHTPPAVLLPRGERKGLLRAVARKFIPPAIVDRPKQGFAIPVGDWLRENYGGLRDLYIDLVISASDPFPESLMGLTINRAYVKQLTDEHMQRKRDHAQRLYLLLVFAIWCRWMQRVEQAQGARRQD
jgi:asparagine synthase (glutamine-hydrolysing)